MFSRFFNHSIKDQEVKLLIEQNVLYFGTLSVQELSDKDTDSFKPLRQLLPFSKVQVDIIVTTGKIRISSQ